MVFHIDKTEYSEGRTYLVEFQHINKDSYNGKRRLANFEGLRGLTTAVIVRDNLVSISTVFCSLGDQFSKEQGRIKALRHALKRCRPFHQDAAAVIEAYNDRNIALSFYIRGLGTLGEPDIVQHPDDTLRASAMAAESGEGPYISEKV